MLTTVASGTACTGCRESPICRCQAGNGGWEEGGRNRGQQWERPGQAGRPQHALGRGRQRRPCQQCSTQPGMVCQLRFVNSLACVVPRVPGVGMAGKHLFVLAQHLPALLHARRAAGGARLSGQRGYPPACRRGCSRTPPTVHRQAVRARTPRCLQGLPGAVLPECPACRGATAACPALPSRPRLVDGPRVRQDEGVAPPLVGCRVPGRAAVVRWIRATPVRHLCKAVRRSLLIAAAWRCAGRPVCLPQWLAPAPLRATRALLGFSHVKQHLTAPYLRPRPWAPPRRSARCPQAWSAWSAWR